MWAWRPRVVLTMAITTLERLATVEEKLAGIEKTLERIETAVTEKLKDHETRIGSAERRIDRVQWLAGVAVVAIGVLATVVTIAEKMGWLP